MSPTAVCKHLPGIYNICVATIDVTNNLYGVQILFLVIVLVFNKMRQSFLMDLWMELVSLLSRGQDGGSCVLYIVHC